jgi:glycosyltransferase involved in cell wall biosynthesis
MRRATLPFFSVFIPAYNRESMIPRAIASVLQQTDQDFELVIVDDGSTDNTYEVARVASSAIPSRTKLIQLKSNLGIPGARNAGLKAAKGRIGVFLDSDDVWHPNFLSIIRRAFETAPNAIFAFTNYLSRGPKFTGPVIQVPGDGMIADPIESMLTKPYIHTMSCFAAPIADMKAIGGFNTGLQRFSDLDLYVRLLAGAKSRGSLTWKKRPFLVIPHIAVLKEIHLKDRPLESYTVAWEKNKRRFLDEIFSYPFMKRRRGLRKNCEICLDEGQRQFFANFS